MTKETITQPRMFRMKDLVDYCGLSRAFIYDKIKEGSFPKGYKLSIGVTAYEKSEVDLWLDKRMGRA